MSDSFSAVEAAASEVYTATISEMDDFVKAHYLKTRPAIVLKCFGLSISGEKVGFISYSAPPKQANVRYGGVVWELSRLYLVDGIKKNTASWFIAQTIRYIKKYHRDVDVLLSYADPSANHVGTVYAASNWTRDGMTDDERKTPRSDYYDKRTGKKYGRKGNMPDDAIVERRPRVSKYRFYYRLKGRSRNE